MKLSQIAKDELFTSKKIYSDMCDAYVEVGLKRIIEYYEYTESDISFPEIFEQSLMELDGYKNELMLKDKPIPFELLYEIDTKAREFALQLDKQCMIFEQLINDSDLTDFKKQHAHEYLAYLDIKDHDRFEKYMMIITDIEDL